MRSINSLKREILENLSTGLQIFRLSSGEPTSVTERKDAIRLSADIAMAAANRGSAFWSRVLISNASRNATQKCLIRRMLKQARYKHHFQNQPINTRKAIDRIRSKKKMLSKSRVGKKARRTAGSSCKKTSGILPRIETPTEERRKVKPRKKDELGDSGLIKSKMEKLKRVLPGGDLMDERLLIGETLDYIMSLRAQVEVMQSLTDNAFQMPTPVRLTM